MVSNLNCTLVFFLSTKKSEEFKIGKIGKTGKILQVRFLTLQVRIIFRE